MNNISNNFQYFLLVLLTLPNYLFAAHNESQANSEGLRESEQCISLVRECFSYHGYNRSNCFFTSATHPFCEGSELASLAYRRWVLSPSDGPKVNAENTGQAHGSSMQAFLGPQLVDPSCIEESDKRLESSLRINTISADTVRKLSAALEACRRDIGLELQRQ
jgi:hypothetical protein